MFTDSRKVGEFFGKNHKYVLEKIDGLLAELGPDPLPKFRQGYSTLPETGDQQHRYFTLDRTAFSLLGMRFTGAKALHWQLA